MKKIAFKTLGCRLNQAETESLASRFSRGGYQVVDFKEPADFYIINTCTVTNQGDSKSRNMIGNVTNRPGKPVLVVTGCMANSQKESLEKNRQITYLVGNESKSHIFELVDAHAKGEVFHLEQGKRNVFDFEPTEKIFHTRGMVKIQDGCDNFCSFCIIPRVRGRAISRAVDEVLENARQNIKRGYKEITLTGVNIGRYQDGKTNFTQLVKRVLELPGDFRTRISSLEPDGLDEEFIDIFNHPKLCPHLHLCLQSGSDRILLKMRRMYTMRDYYQLVEKINHKYPGFSFSTDIMVGFPGETGEDFKETCKTVESIGFNHVHTFKYSPRDKTRAARMVEQVPDNIKDEWSRTIRDISARNRLKYFQTFKDKLQVVLTERVGVDNLVQGYGEHYLPVVVKSGDIRKNRFVKTRITGMDTENLVLLGEDVGGESVIGDR